MATVPNIGERSADRASISEARRAFFDSDFERCTSLCEAIHAAGDSTRFEVALLRARVFVRLDDPIKAIDALRSCAFAPLSADEYVSGEMVLGTAYVRLGKIQRGATILERAHREPRDVHRTIRAEVATNLGVARFLLGNFADARKLLLSVEPEADIVHARALEYLGWIAFVSDNTAVSAESFRSALYAVDRSKNRDHFVEANVLKGLTAVFAERLQVDEWPALEARIRAFNWSANGLASAHFWTAISASVMCEMVGDIQGARDWVQRAESTSNEPTFGVVAYCRLAALFRGIGEPQAQLEFVARAYRLYERINLRYLAGDLVQVPIALAEELAFAGLTRDATRLIQQYRDLVAPDNRRVPAMQRYAAVENAIEATLLESSGHREAASRLYETAFTMLNDAGLLRRACFVALRLADISHETRYVEYVHDSLRPLPKYWLSREIEKFDRDTGLRLSPSQSDILRLVAEGQTYKEIAALRGGSWKTARNLVHALFRKFGVRSKGELVAAAARRGVLDRFASGLETRRRR